MEKETLRGSSMKTRQEIRGMMNEGISQYSSKMAQSDLVRLTDGYYRLDGYTGRYEILAGNKVVCRQRSANSPTLRELVIAALGLYFDHAE
jgi:hypothetical protein